MEPPKSIVARHGSHRLADGVGSHLAPPCGCPAQARFDRGERLSGKVLAGIASGERSKEVGACLGITRRTVETYLNSIYIKLNVDSRAAAVAVAIERGLLPRRREES